VEEDDDYDDDDADDVINGTVVEKNVIEDKMCVLIFLKTFVCNISYSKKMSARYDHKYILVSAQSVWYSYHVLMKVEFCR